MATYNVPGLSVGLLLDRQPHTAGWGVTNLDYPRPVDSATVFQIGSSTKPFTGAALARPVDQGKVDLDAPFGRTCRTSAWRMRTRWSGSR